LSVEIQSVVPHSPCAKKGIAAGDRLLAVNGHEVFDVLDYRFHILEKNPVLDVEDRNGRRRAVRLKKEEDGDCGLEFSSYLMDAQKRCRNNCVFCFIDQLPKGLRESLYFKDDDSRLSFLFGNYITLTNLTQREARRIIEMHISPVNVSVHTMNPVLRCEMMRNPKAGESLAYLKRFAEAGIQINTQLVLCPGVNDGKELEFTLGELGELYPSVQSIAAVPVGLTTCRDGLTPLKAFDRGSAGAVIDAVDRFNRRFSNQTDHGPAYPADEFFILAGREMPGGRYYGSYPQLENGVGLWTLFREEFSEALRSAECPAETRPITVATGRAAFPLINELVDEAGNKWHNLKVKTVAINNILFGESITVAGLLAGKDYCEQLSGLALGDGLLIPEVSLRREGDLFLDNMELAELSERLRVKITAVPNSGAAFLKALAGRRE